MQWVVDHSYLIPLLPLAGACIAGMWGARRLRQQSHWPIWIGVGLSAVMSIVLLLGMINAVPRASHGAEAEATAERAEPTFSITRDWFTWIAAGDPREGSSFQAGDIPTYFVATAGALFDPLSAVMLCVVTGIGFLITVFSKGYMQGESGYFRFFAYLGLFIFAMTILVMGNNLIMLYLGWEGVGLCSYLLIGYYYERPSAREAAKKAFIVNRIGDFGFGIGIMLCFLVFGTVSYFGAGAGTGTGILDRAATEAFTTHLFRWQQHAIDWIPFFLMVGAFGKSAQFPLYVWLPDAMEGPTPVSALIHAATMVTAGVYMIVRCGALFYGNQAALVTIACIGAFTALFAATIALRQFDLKKVFAYSTISQLGYMFVGAAVLAPVAGIFHLVTHAFFKALLFLSSGVVMHAMSGELDMRKMSGLRRVLPITNIVIGIGCLALAGFPLLSGFFSKDQIVGAAMHQSFILFLVLLFTSFLTAYYTFRLYFRVFWGPLVVPEAPAPAHGHGHEPHEHAAASDSAVATGTAPSSGVDVGQAHGASAHDHGHGAHDHGHHNHEPPSMMLPLILLAAGTILASFLIWNEGLAHFLGKSPSLARGLEMAQRFNVLKIQHAEFGREFAGEVRSSEWLGWIIGGAVSIVGILLAYMLHLADRRRAEVLAERLQPMTSLIEHKYWVDETYQAYIIEPLRNWGKFLFGFDRWIVDGLVNVTGFVPQIGGGILRIVVQRGALQGYAMAMLLGIMLILIFIFL